MSEGGSTFQRAISHSLPEGDKGGRNEMTMSSNKSTERKREVKNQ